MTEIRQEHLARIKTVGVYQAGMELYEAIERAEKAQGIARAIAERDPLIASEIDGDPYCYQATPE